MATMNEYLSKPIKLPKRLKATPAELDYAARYTRVAKINGEFQPILKVDNQSFQFHPAMETLADAKVICWMMAKALLKIGR